MDLPGLPGRRVEAFRRYAYKRFYARPKAALRLLALIQPRAARHIFRNMARFLSWVRPG
jgi:hypothetical protein